VTDIFTLDKLLRAPVTSVGLTFGTVKRAEIVMFLPLDLLTAIELRSTGWSVHSLAEDSPRESLMKQAALWLGLRPALDRLERLSKIDIWLDHNRHKYWWEFNEAAILSPFAGLASRSGVKLTAHLPMHAADHVPVPPFVIRRRRRQEYFIDSCIRCEKRPERCSSMFLHRQFPLYDGFEVYDLEDEQHDWDALERTIWASGFDPGEDIDDLFRQCRSCGCCRNF
jgi:hypothetical protein